VDLPAEARFCPRCGTPQKQAAEDPLVNRKLDDRYLLLELVGEGGSGKVYMARHVALGKRVAVKILHRALVHDSQASERFRKEAQAVANLENPHILQVFDYGQTPDGSPYIVMELLQGETLAARLSRKKTLSLQELLPIFEQIADGLGEAHALGYVHRDLRPRNIMLVEKDGRSDFVKILDFGLAKIIHPGLDPAVSGIGFIFGDPTYSAPETMKTGTVDSRVDIYSLGIIVYQVLSGHPPFVGDTAFDVMSKHLDADVPKLEGAFVSVPRGIDEVLAKALAKNPEQRYRTVLQFFEALSALGKQPVVPPAHAVKHPVFIGTNSYLNLQAPVRNSQTPVLARMPGGGVLQMTPELPPDDASSPPAPVLPANSVSAADPSDGDVRHDAGKDADLPDDAEELPEKLPLGAPSQSFMAREEMRLQERLQEQKRMHRLWMLIVLGGLALLGIVWGIRSCLKSGEDDAMPPSTTDLPALGIKSETSASVPMEPPAEPMEPPAEPMEPPAEPMEPPAEPMEPPAEPNASATMAQPPAHSVVPKTDDMQPSMASSMETVPPMQAETADDLKTARELFASGQAGRAFEIAMSAARSNPGNTAAWQLAGECAFETGQWQAAETAYTRLAQLQPSARNWYRLGSAQLKQGKTSEARKNFQKSLEIDPQFGPAKNALEKLP